MQVRHGLMAVACVCCFVVVGADQVVVFNE